MMNRGTELLIRSLPIPQLTIRASALVMFIAVGKVTVSEMMNRNGTVPAGLAASEISQTGAKIDWDAVANATYTLRYKKADDTNWTEVNNLTTNTYNFWIGIKYSLWM